MWSHAGHTSQMEEENKFRIISVSLYLSVRESNCDYFVTVSARWSLKCEIGSIYLFTYLLISTG